MITCLGLMMAFGTLCAQTTTTYQQPPARPDAQRPRLSAEQRAQLITDRMAKAYDLSAEQKTKLLELNTRTLKQREDRLRRMRDNKDWKKNTPCPNNKDCKKDGKKSNKDCKKNKKDCKNYKKDCPKANGNCSKPNGNCPKANSNCSKPNGNCPNTNGNWQKNGPRRGNAYSHALRGILTPEQFRAYLTDKAIERELSPRQGARPMPRRGFNAPCCGSKDTQVAPYKDKKADKKSGKDKKKKEKVDAKRK